MSLPAIGADNVGSRQAGAGQLPISLVQRAVLFVLIASSWFVTVEPAPYEFLFVVAALIYLFGGLQLHLAIVPLILFILLYNLGGVFSVVQVAKSDKAVMFVIVSVYLALTAIFFALAVTKDPSGTMRVIRAAWIFAGLIGAVAGLVGYFNIAGMGETWAPLARAQGTFKDPNVLAAYLVAPAVFIIQDILLGRRRWTILKIPVLGIISFCIFLAFSRGGWINFVATALLMTGFAVRGEPIAGGSRPDLRLFRARDTLCSSLIVGCAVVRGCSRGVR